MSVLMENVKRRKSHRISNDIFIVLPPTLRAVGWWAVLLFFCTLIYLSLAVFAKKETLSGVLHSQSDPVKVQPGNAGVVTDVLVQDGQVVQKGDPLFRLSRVTFLAGQQEHNEGQTLQQNYAAIEEQERLAAEWPRQHQATLADLSQKVQRVQAEIVIIDEQLTTVKRRLTLAENQLERLGSIEIEGYISSLEVNRQRDTVLVLRQQLEELNRVRLQMVSTLTSYQHEQERARFTDQEKQQQFSEAIRALRQQTNAIRERTEEVVVSPVDGMVDNLQLKRGQTVQALASTLSIVPQKSNLTLTLYAPARSAVFIRTGQAVKIRYHQFPYQRFGTYSGTVSRVGRAVVMPEDVSKIKLAEPSYEVDVQLTQQITQSYGQSFELYSGMTAEVDVITERQTLLYWLFEPVLALYRKF